MRPCLPRSANRDRKEGRVKSGPSTAPGSRPIFLLGRDSGFSLRRNPGATPELQPPVRPDWGRGLKRYVRPSAGDRAVYLARRSPFRSSWRLLVSMRKRKPARKGSRRNREESAASRELTSITRPEAGDQNRWTKWSASELFPQTSPCV